MTAAAPLVMGEIQRMAESLQEEMKNNQRLRKHTIGFAQRLAMIKKRGIVPGIGTAPYSIVVAERKGYPPVELQSLAHCNGKHVAEGNCAGTRVPARIDHIGNGAQP
jgi:hypothetical protein